MRWRAEDALWSVASQRFASGAMFAVGRVMRTVLLVFFVLGVTAAPAVAHCDTYDGPVVQAGQKALAAGNLDFALIWVKPAAESELRAVFKQAVEVRKLGAKARELADQFFLETLVRLHRAGEGEPYTGIKPKGTEVGPAIKAADAAITSRSPRAVSTLLTDATNAGLHRRLELVLARREYKPTDIKRGRDYVEAYVAFTHYVERIYEASTLSANDHHAH